MRKKIGLLVPIIGIACLSFQKKPAFDLQASITRGKDVYLTQCITCHMEQGEGIEGVYPPVAKSDYLMADKYRSIRQVLKGASGEMTVNGKLYNLEMIAIDLSEQDAVDVLNYVRNSFGNKGEAVVPADIKAALQ